MSRYANVSSVPLSIAVFLATDTYDHNPDPTAISATALLKPLRQIVLSARVPEADAQVDLVQMTQSRIGSAIHSAVEYAWINNHVKAMTDMGIPQKVIDKVLVNPKPEDLFDGCIPVYLEQRSSRQVGKWTIAGKYDFVGDGRVEDVKSTSTYTVMHGVNDEKFAWQGSIYRWLNPTIITKDDMAIQYIFTDWSKIRAMTDLKYPQQRTMQKIFPLKSLQETEAFIVRKLSLIDQYWDADEADVPECNNEELWRSEPLFKYYKNPLKTQRSTKNFETHQEAMIRKAEDGGVGIVIEHPGRVTACKFCAAFPVCSQKDALIASGDLVL